MFHAVVCHSLKQGWGDNQTDMLKQCFDAIPAEGEPIASIAIGTGYVGIVSGADFHQIVYGMDKSEQKIILHCPCTMEDIKGYIREEKKRQANLPEENEEREVFVELGKELCRRSEIKRKIEGASALKKD